MLDLEVKDISRYLHVYSVSPSPKSLKRSVKEAIKGHADLSSSYA